MRNGQNPSSREIKLRGFATAFASTTIWRNRFQNEYSINSYQKLKTSMKTFPIGTSAVSWRFLRLWSLSQLMSSSNSSRNVVACRHCLETNIKHSMYLVERFTFGYRRKCLTWKPVQSRKSSSRQIAIFTLTTAQDVHWVMKSVLIFINVIKIIKTFKIKFHNNLNIIGILKFYFFCKSLYRWRIHEFRFFFCFIMSRVKNDLQTYSS